MKQNGTRVSFNSGDAKDASNAQLWWYNSEAAQT